MTRFSHEPPRSGLMLARGRRVQRGDAHRHERRRHVGTERAHAHRTLAGSRSWVAVTAVALHVLFAGAVERAVPAVDRLDHDVAVVVEIVGDAGETCFGRGVGVGQDLLPAGGEEQGEATPILGVGAALHQIRVRRGRRSVR